MQAKVWYTESEKVYYNQEILKETGDEEKKFGIKFNKFQINFYKTLSKFEIYDTIYTEQNLKIFSNFYLPITLGISTYYELEEQKISLTKEEAKEKLIEKLKNELSAEIEEKDNIQDIKVNILQETNKEVEVEVIYEVLESIGTEEKIIY